jgi:hypothetical protein
MPSSILTAIPFSVRAGDSWRWRIVWTEYPADVWTLTYTLWTASAAITLTATASGKEHLIEALPAATANYAPGRYGYAARVTNGTDAYTVDTGNIEILPAVGAAMDTRSHARRMLDAIDAILENRASDGDLDVVRTQTGSGSTEFDPIALLRYRRQFAAAVASEEAAARIARGEKSGRFVQVRFTG